jgi:hypothetical protein
MKSPRLIRSLDNLLSRWIRRFPAAQVARLYGHGFADINVKLVRNRPRPSVKPISGPRRD